MTRPSQDTTLPTGTQLRRRYQGLTGVTSAISLTVVSLYLLALLSLTSEQWSSFFWFVGLVAPGLTLLQWFALDPPRWRPIEAYLDARVAGEPDLEVRCEAFRSAIDFPRFSASCGLLWWSAGGAALALWLTLVAGVPRYSALVIATAAVTGGFVGVLFHGFAAKRMLTPLRETLARELPDLDVRQGLVRRLTLRTKVIASVTGVTLVVVSFAIFLAQVSAARAIELSIVRHQAVLLARAAEDFETSLDDLEVTEEMAALGVEFLLLDPDARRVVGGAPGVLSPQEVAAVADAIEIEPFGDSRHFDSSTAFAWQSLWNGRVLVAYTPWEALMGSGRSWHLFLALLGVAMLVAMGLGLALSREVCSGARAIGEEIARVAAGDLSPGRTYESEDELGDLARSFQRMTGFLRATVGSVAEAADRVESAAAEFASVGDAVADATAAQREGVLQAGESMGRIRGEVAGIADSAQSLNSFMEESSSSVAELGAVGEELSQNAQVLSSKVDESSSSVEEMARSVSEVADNAEGLHEAASDTSTSMEEMAASMREVEGNASETARLSKQVAQMADQGRDKVRQTIDGMYAIHEATDTAQRVITSLGERVKEIGAIVEVIDDVADETNLLALNAAIIAAQAGDHGRSFSVVADEIKELADRVLSSTKEIDGQIRSVQQESANAIGAIARGAESVQSGVDLSAEAGVALEQITEAARGAGDRIIEIVSAVQEQAKASAHVVGLMDRVRTGVEQIRIAGQEQGRSNQVVLGSCTTMREVAEQVRSTTEEQSRGSRRIGDSVESVRSAVEQINRSLQEQSTACGTAVEFLDDVNQNTATNQQSTERMREAMRGLVQQAEVLRESVQRFQL